MMKWLLVFASQVFLAASSNVIDYQPMVAFKCGKPAMYMTKKGWQQDLKSDCLTDPVDVLKYCRKIYKGLDITNAVELGHEVSISNWCSKKTKYCKSSDSEIVRPVRCVEGTFHSDALLVPDGCHFDHVHDEKVCQSPRELHGIAKKRCAEMKMTLNSHEWLEPCGVDLLTGVEFVCCPIKQKLEKQDLRKNEIIPKKTEKEVKVPPQGKHKIVPKKGVSWDDYDKMKELPKNTMKEYNSYIEGKAMKSFYNEHDRYRVALAEWEDDYHDKVVKLNKEWTDERDKVRELRRKDPKTAAKLDATIQERFRKTYEALKGEGDMGRQQLDRIHQDRVGEELQERKREAFDRFLDALSESKQDADEIERSLRRYIKLEEKDKLHTLNRFQHIRDLTGDAYVMERAQMPTHIKEIDMRIEESLDFVEAKVDKKFKSDILKSTQKYIDSYVDLAKSIKNTIFKDYETKDSIFDSEDSDDSSYSDDSSDSDDSSYSDDSSKSDDSSEHDEKFGGAGGVVGSYKHQFDESSRKSEKNGLDQDVDEFEDEHRYDSNVAADGASLQQSLDVSSSIAAAGSNAGLIAGSVVGVVVLMLVSLIVVRAVRTRRNRPTITHTFVEVSPEEQHVASMQAKGYENPTYKFFERQTSA